MPIDFFLIDQPRSENISVPDGCPGTLLGIRLTSTSPERVAARVSRSTLIILCLQCTMNNANLDEIVYHTKS